MAAELGVGDELMEHCEQFVQYDHLFGGAVVLVLLDVEIFPFSLFPYPSAENDLVLTVSAFRADAEAVCVVSDNVAADDLDGTGVVEGAVAMLNNVYTLLNWQ